MVEYNKVNLKLSNLQLSKLKNVLKNNNGTTLRIDKKNFNKDELLHELFLTQGQLTKLRDKVGNNISADIKLSKAQIKKKKVRRSFSINFREIFTKINKTSYFTRKKHITSSWIKCINVCYRCCNSKKMYGSGPKTTVVFSNEDLNDMTKIVKALEDSDVLMKGVTKTLKNDIKNVVIYQLYQC